MGAVGDEQQPPRGGRVERPAARANPAQSAGTASRAVRTASGLAPDRARISTDPSQSVSPLVPVCSSSTAWKLLPPNPKALRAARREWSARGSHGRFSVFT